MASRATVAGSTRPVSAYPQAVTDVTCADDTPGRVGRVSPGKVSALSSVLFQARPDLDGPGALDSYRLPQPPSDDERDSYLGPQQRWVAWLSFLGSVLTVVSVAYFVANRWWAAFLLVPMIVSAVGALASLATVTRRRRDTLSGHAQRVRSWSPVHLPSVDVLLPSAGEPLEVLHNTFMHVSRLRWAGELQVVVLDDSARPAVQQLAESFGLKYLTRPDRGHLKKAGNLRHGYERTSGAIIAIFDADFVPRADYLYELAPYFDDADIAIVQSPQFFDLNRSMNWVQYAAGSTQVLFYKWIQAARDSSDAAICVGTCALYRRSALQAAGGFAQIGHSEDVHTGVNVMAAGYRVRYVPTVVSKGLCPDGLAQFITQQYRWCTGSMSLLMDKSFHRRRMTFMQRLSYWSGFLYYLSTAVEVFVIPVPALLLAFFAPGQLRVTNYIFVLLALVVRQAVVPVITLGRDSLVSLTRIQTSYAFAHAVALADAVRGREDAWVATGTAGSSPTSARVLRLARVWFAVTQTLLWSVVLWRGPAFGWLPYGSLAVFAALNLLIMYPIVLNRTDFSRADPMAVRRRLTGVLR